MKAPIDLAGKIFGRLTAISLCPKSGWGIKWLCRCECGNERQILSSSLLNGKIKSCGCRNVGGIPEDLTGQVYGNWLFLKISDRKSGEKLRWDCQCLLCGTIRPVVPSNIKSGTSFSCGCVKSKAEFTMSKILQENNVRFDSQKKFDGCVYKSSLFFDFYIPELNLCIETDGEQHYFPAKMFGGEEGFKYRKMCDQIKNTYCFEHNINLLRIPYTQFHRLEEICKENKII